MIGQLPVWLGNITSLDYLDLSENMMVGSIPCGIGNMRSLSYLDLSEHVGWQTTFWDRKPDKFKLP
jgi:Leucine-rich repeat (LRR) protein